MIYALISDLIFRSKLKEATGGAVCFLASLEDLRSALSSTTDLAPRLLVDLHAKSVDPFELAELARKLHPKAEIICFYSHVHSELATRAQQAGASQVIPRSRFDAMLKTLLSSQAEAKGDNI